MPNNKYCIEGQTFTAKQLADKLDIHYHSARRRLKTCTTLDELLKPKSHNGTGLPIRIYTIEDKEFTTKGLAKELGIDINAARYRLNKATTINDLYKPLKKANCINKSSKKELLDCEMFKLALKVI